MADAVKVGADLGGQDAFGVFLLDDIFVEISFQFLGLQIEINLAELICFAFFFVIRPRFGYPIWRNYLDTAAVFFTQVVTDLFFQFFLVGDFVHFFFVLFRF